MLLTPHATNPTNHVTRPVTHLHLFQRLSILYIPREDIMRIAVQGCSHGCLSQIYDSIAQYEQAKSTKIDLLLLCGDFQALRSSHDFASLAVPPKYQALGTFHEYYSGKRVAPVLTLVIGGNHEASNHMWELYHGGWLAPNIYYLGGAGSVRVNGLRIMGASGIYKYHDYNKGVSLQRNHRPGGRLTHRTL